MAMLCLRHLTVRIIVCLPQNRRSFLNLRTEQLCSIHSIKPWSWGPERASLLPLNHWRVAVNLSCCMVLSFRVSWVDLIHLLLIYDILHVIEIKPWIVSRCCIFIADTDPPQVIRPTVLQSWRIAASEKRISWAASKVGAFIDSCLLGIVWFDFWHHKGLAYKRGGTDPSQDLISVIFDHLLIRHIYELL